MKVKLRGRISMMVNLGPDGKPSADGLGQPTWVKLQLNAGGSVEEGHKSSESKDAGGSIELRVKPLVARELKFGQELIVVITTAPETE